MGYEITMYIGHAAYFPNPRALARRTSDKKYTTVSGHRGVDGYGFSPEVQDNIPIYGYEDDEDTQVDLDRATLQTDVELLFMDMVLELDKCYGSPLGDFQHNTRNENYQKIYMYRHGGGLLFEDPYGDFLKAIPLEEVWEALKERMEDADGNFLKNDHGMSNVAYWAIKNLMESYSRQEFFVAFYGH